MIDNDVLEELLQEAAASIRVPADGAAQVLAARNAMGTERTRLRRHGASGGRGRLPRPRVAVAGVIVAAAMTLLVATLANVGGPGRSSHDATVPNLGTAAGAATGPINGSAGALGSAGVAGSSASGSSPPGLRGTPGSPVQLHAAPAPTPPAPTAPLGVATKVIKTGSVSLQVGQGRVNATINQLTSLATALNGYVASTNTTAGNGEPATGDLTLRVPASSFESLLNQVRRLGTPTAVTTTGQDVTGQYVDVRARLQSLEATRTQFQQILTRAQSIGDILAVEQQINDIQTQIEQLQGQLRVLDGQTTFGSLAVHVAEQTKQSIVTGPPKPASGVTRAWDHARHSFARGLEGVVGALGGIAVFLTCVLVLVLLGRLSWVVVRRRLV